MAQFFIDLPNNRQGNVRTGIKRKEQKTFLHLLMPWKKIDTEEKLAYIVEVNPVDDIREYRLLKTKDGKWLQEGEDKWLCEGDGKLNLLIKKAIDEYESGIRKTA
ncbi:hypothetical protein [Parafilimonas terrae]|uniref:Uncharacterized protein n=1 Tax=Parafilimonas terrae TaxID=1465490 RepID=A0A1I5Y0G2_9BACT|nr:hypothetical protein [Parafilimonas terrae]SFQ37656.1 hypothetical protein SAMN05444277_11064 [Parafilimonas terrae]